jgi:hypothetical protein
MRTEPDNGRNQGLSVRLRTARTFSDAYDGSRTAEFGLEAMYDSGWASPEINMEPEWGGLVWTTERMAPVCLTGAIGARDEPGAQGDRAGGEAEQPCCVCAAV